jgi:hypothetical protein
MGAAVSTYLKELGCVDVSWIEVIIIYTNKCTIISLLKIHHAYMFRPNWSSSGHLQDTKVLKCV